MVPTPYRTVWPISLIKNPRVYCFRPPCMLLIFRVWFFNPKFSMVNPKLVAVCYHGVNSCFILFYHQDLSEFAQVNSPCSSHLGAGLCWAGTPAKPRAMKREMLWTPLHQSWAWSLVKCCFSGCLFHVANWKSPLKSYVNIGEPCGICLSNWMDHGFHSYVE